MVSILSRPQCVEVCSCILSEKFLKYVHVSCYGNFLPSITHVLMEMYCLCHWCAYGNFLLFMTRNNVFCGINNWEILSKLNCLFILPCITKIYTGKALNRGPFQKRLQALRFSTVNKIHLFQGMGMIFCVEFQRVPLKFHTKYLTHTLKDTIFIQRWNFKSS